MTSSSQAPGRRGRAARPALIVIAGCVVVGALIGARLAIAFAPALNAPVLDAPAASTASSIRARTRCSSRRVRRGSSVPPTSASPGFPACGPPMSR